MSNKQRIERLTFTTFRGATKPVTFQFQPNQSIILIFGENGTGKSTIADAIDFLCNNDFGSLRQRSGTTPRTHIVAEQGKAADLAVELVYGGNVWKATLKGGKPVTTPDQPPRALILRRADLTRIMEATDSERYKSLQEFITVPHIEKCETVLRALVKTVSSEVDEAIGQKSTAESTLQQFWKAEGELGANYMEWARRAAQQPIVTLKQKNATDKALLKAIDQAVDAETHLTAAVLYLEQVRTAHAALDEQLQSASQAQSNADLVDTLEAARSYLHGHPDANSCPVCMKAEPQSSLVMLIDGQLAHLKTIQDLRHQLAQSVHAMQRAEGAQTNAQQRWRTAYAELITRLQAADPADWLAALVHASDSSGDQAKHDTLHHIASERAILVQTIDIADKRIAQHNALTTHLATIDQLNSTMLGKSELSKRLAAMLDIVAEERKKFVTRIVNSISGTVAQFYRRLHPDEPLGALCVYNQ